MTWVVNWHKNINTRKELGMRTVLSTEEWDFRKEMSVASRLGRYFWMKTERGPLRYSSDKIGISWVQFSRSVLSNSLQPHGLQHARLPCPPTLRACSNSCPLSWWCLSTISSSVVPFSSCLNLSQHQGIFQWVTSSHQVAKILEFQLQHQSFQWIFRDDFL